ncbi:hypothetical protein NEUTE2DRAFT_162994 [Neurospora tetrasperma FGSC 2509]|nr:hypothetical protein NEUTE2DRAFT_162994 [Neurospora tetrasperma FGSC 2509]
MLETAAGLQRSTFSGIPESDLFLYLGSFLLPLTAFGFSPGLVPWTDGAWEAIDGEGFPRPTLKAELPVESHLAVPRREPYCPREGARDGLKDVPSTSSQQSPYCLTARY